MSVRFLDTSVLLRLLTADDPVKAGRVSTLLQRVENGQERVAVSQTVIFETVFTLQRGYKISKVRVRELVSPIIAMSNLALPNKQDYFEALDLYATSPLSFADAFNVVYMRRQGLHEIYSWDMDFDRVQGITRVEP